MKPARNIHLCDSSGQSVLNADFLSAEVDRLRKENAELRRQLVSIAKRRRQLADADQASAPITLH